MPWVAHTVYEGRWPFTMADTPEQAIDNFLAAIIDMRVLSLPSAANKITAVKANEYDYSFNKTTRRLVRRLSKPVA